MNIYKETKKIKLSKILNLEKINVFFLILNLIFFLIKWGGDNIEYPNLTLDEILEMDVIERGNIPLDYYMLVYMEYLKENPNFKVPQYNDLKYSDFHKMSMEQYKALPNEIIKKFFSNVLNKGIERVMMKNDGSFDDGGSYDMDIESKFLLYEHFLQFLFKLRDNEEEHIKMDIIKKYEKDLIEFDYHIPFLILNHIDLEKRLKYLNKKVEFRDALHNFIFNIKYQSLISFMISDPLTLWCEPDKDYISNFKEFLKRDLEIFIENNPKFEPIIK